MTARPDIDERCSACSAPLRPGAKFCVRCGAPRSARPPRRGPSRAGRTATAMAIAGIASLGIALVYWLTVSAETAARSAAHEKTAPVASREPVQTTLPDVPPQYRVESSEAETNPPPVALDDEIAIDSPPSQVRATPSVTEKPRRPLPKRASAPPPVPAVGQTPSVTPPQTLAVSEPAVLTAPAAKPAETAPDTIARAEPTSPSASRPPQARTPAPSEASVRGARTIDQLYRQRTAVECKEGLAGVVCREIVRFELCRDRWSRSEVRGTSVCHVPPHATTALN